MMMREARNRKSSNSCWIRDGPENELHILTSHIALLNTHKHLKHVKRLQMCVHVSFSLLTKMFLLISTQWEQCLDEAEVSRQEDVVCLAGLHLSAPTRLEVVKPGDLVLQHGGCTHFYHLHLWSCRGWREKQRYFEAETGGYNLSIISNLLSRTKILLINRPEKRIYELTG